MEEKNDLKNAFNVLCKVNEYVKEELNKVPKEDRQLIELRLLYLDSDDYPRFRGGSNTYLYLKHTKIVVTNICNDGWSHSEDICLTRQFRNYYYNANERTTIWLAAKIAENWTDIKDKIKKEIAEYMSDRGKASNLLQNFDI